MNFCGKPHVSFAQWENNVLTEAFYFSSKRYKICHRRRCSSVAVHAYSYIFFVKRETTSRIEECISRLSIVK